MKTTFKTIFIALVCVVSLIALGPLTSWGDDETPDPPWVPSFEPMSDQWVPSFEPMSDQWVPPFEPMSDQWVPPFEPMSDQWMPSFEPNPIWLPSGGGSAAGEGAPTSFTTSTLFPLSSGWETDKWTLFVDINDHDINGVSTRAMADTQEPKVLYWTNDAQGLRLHAVRNDEGDLWVFPTPILFADRVCNIGDVKTGAFLIDTKEFNYTITFAAVEDVTVPAGHFPNCARFEFFVYPVTDQPSQYGTETFWLADGVGFVKGQADDLADSDLFTLTGETRQLLSYHLTPSNLSAEEQALREAYMKFGKYWLDGDLDMMESMMHPQYYSERCQDKDSRLAGWENFIDDIDVVADLVTLEDVQINGDEAVVIREELSGYVPKEGGDVWWEWGRLLRKWKMDGGEWKYYGAQTEKFRPDFLNVYLRNDASRTPGTEEHIPMEAGFLKCGTNEWIDDPPNVINSLTVTGPPGSGISDLDLKPYWIGGGGSPWRLFWAPDVLTDPISGFYTFRVEDEDGDYFVITDYLEAAPQLAVPVHVSPTDGEIVSIGNVTLSWNSVVGADDYRVDMSYSTDGGTTWYGMPNQYTADTQVTVNVDQNTVYEWRVRAKRYDVYGEMDNQSRSDWTQFATYDVFRISGGYLQYRTYSDGSNAYGGWLEFTKINQPIEASDITLIELKDSADNPVATSGTSFSQNLFYWGKWNESTSSVDFVGPLSISGFGISFPEGTNLSAGNYSYEATTIEGDLLTLERYFPGETILPVVATASMNYEWLGDGGLRLTWSVPAGGGYDQLRIDLYTQDEDDLLYVGLPADKEELTIPVEWIQKMTDLKNPSSAVWRIVTRSFSGDGNNHARGYSSKVTIPWSGAGG